MSEEATAGKSFFTPFNVIAGLIIIVGLILTVQRFVGGLASVTALYDYNPWGIWIGFDLLVGVALAAGGYLWDEKISCRCSTCDSHGVPGVCTGSPYAQL